MIPIRVVVSEKTVKAGTFEVKDRRSGDVSHVLTEKVIDRVV